MTHRDGDPADRPNQLEIVYGFVAGEDPSAPPLPDPDIGARAALEQCLAAALQCSPCGVSFSGGRDSSAVLALAAHVAKREGLPLPVPYTLRFPDVPESDEADWQERVVRHLRLPEWERIEIRGPELDFVGPVAGRTLRRHGILWPPNTAFHAPLLSAAAGGCLLTGIDGDVLFAGWRWERGNRPGLARSYPVLRLARGLPPAARARVAARTMWRPPWTTPAAAGPLARWQAATWDVEPRRWSDRVAWWWRRRYLRVIRSGLDAVAGDAGARIAHPLLDADFVAALASEGGDRGFGGRGPIMEHLFGDLLPRAVLERQSKALFNSALWSDHTRAFVAAWDGSGVDEQFVDADALRREWCKPVPHFGSATLLQSAWLASQR